jgi:peptidoglycan hydrolase-like protein with peptidoglycan-binding domain
VILGAILSAVLLAVIGLFVAASVWSGATLSADASALARIHTQAFAGKLESEAAFAPDGHRIRLAVAGDRLTPLEQLTPGEVVTVQVVIRRPGMFGWILGKTKTERLTLRAPVAHLNATWLTVAAGAPVRVSFDQPVRAVAFGTGGHLATRRFSDLHGTVSLGRFAPVGSVQVAASARPWETLGPLATVSWFPKTGSPVALASPPVSSHISPTSPLRLTFSQPVSQVLGGARPQLSPAIAGTWSQPDGHTLVFRPSGIGAALGTAVHLTLPSAVAVAGPDGAIGQATRTLSWVVPPGSTLRLQQLLAEAGYLPVRWHPSGPPIAPTEAAQVAAAVNPPPGTFTWRFQNTPDELKALWQPGQPNSITRGAVMAYQSNHSLTVDAVAGAEVWRSLIGESIKGVTPLHRYSYVYVRTASPQLMTLWSNGQTILTSPGNTGIASAPTQAGTFPVFEHIASGTMSGTNPDGSKYNDPGIRWISYFNGGDALHAFTRASFGTPQSLGCVELPLAAAARVWPYTPIGTLVTVEPSSVTTNA